MRSVGSSPLGTDGSSLAQIDRLAVLQSMLLRSTCGSHAGGYVEDDPLLLEEELVELAVASPLEELEALAPLVLDAPLLEPSGAAASATGSSVEP